MGQVIANAKKYEREATFFYYLWFVIYLTLGLSAIVLPGLAAVGVPFGADGTKYLAGLGALAAAIYGFLKPNEYIASFDAAIAELRSIQARDGIVPDAQLVDRLDACLRLMSFKYQNLPTPSPAPAAKP